MVPRSGYRPRVLLLVAVAAMVVACGDGAKNAEERQGKLPVSPGAINEVPQEIHTISVFIDDGKFQSDRYVAQPGPLELIVITRQGGPYTLTIEPLVTPQALPANATTEVGFTAPGPGEYAMRLIRDGAIVATATLDICPPGSR